MRFWGVLGLVAGLLWSSVSLANVVITGTRVVYPAQNKEIGIQLNNVGNSPALLQAWISDANDDRTTPTPFVITPPIFRMDGKKQQTLRVIYTHEPLAQDRETLFYFNLLDIPPVPEMDESAPQNYLQFSLLSKLKFFYRPKNLKPAIEKSYNYLTATKNGSALTINNPTPYHMTVSNVALLANKDDVEPLITTNDTPMIKPFEQATITLDSTASTNLATVAKLTLINDYGGEINILTPLMTAQ